MKIQRASLSALVRRRIYNDNEYPAIVYQILDKQIHARFMPPIVRAIRQDHKELEIESIMRVRGSGLKEGDCVLIQRQDDYWIITTILSRDIYFKNSTKRLRSG